MAKDSLGAEVEPGDLAVYVTSGRYTTRGIVEVLSVNARAKVRWIKADRSVNSTDTISIDTHSLFVVEKFKGELPKVE